jgi:hypothetical protein
MDIIAEEQLENAPERIEDPNDSSVDLLGDAIVEVYGPSHKHQCMEDMIAEETVEQAKVLSGSSKTVETEQPTVQLTHNLINSDCRFWFCPSSVFYVNLYGVPRATNRL